MKRILMMIALLLAGATMGFAQFFDLNDQIGTTYVYEVENAMTGKLSAKSTVISIDGNNITLRTVTEMPMGMPEIEVLGIFAVEDNKVLQDVDSFIEAMQKQMGTAMGGGMVDIDLEGEPSITYLTGKVGDTFPLTSYKMTINMQGMALIVNATMTQNEVVAEEEITTPAGTFQTFVVESAVSTESSVMGQKQIVEQTAKSWIVPGKGIVKSITKSQGQTTTMTLVEIQNP